MLLDLDLEAKLRVDLESARERFLKSAAELDLLAVIARGETSREDASLVVRELRIEHRIAIDEFEFALQRYVDYVLGRKIGDTPLIVCPPRCRTNNRANRGYLSVTASG